MSQPPGRGAAKAPYGDTAAATWSLAGSATYDNGVVYLEGSADSHRERTGRPDDQFEAVIRGHS